MKINNYFMMLFVVVSLLTSCSSDDDFIQDTSKGNDSGNEEPEELAPYQNGILVLNEGVNDAGTVSFITNDLETIENTIFENNNNDMDLGNFVQSMFFDDENAYLISNGTNIITVVDRYTFEYKGIVDSGLSVPYYGVAYNGKAYVSNLAGFSTGEDDYIAVIDLQTFEVEKSIVAGTYLDEVKENNDLIYVEGASFGQGNSIKVFDPNTNSFVRTITTSTGLNSFEIDGQFIYALSSNKLQKIDLNTGNENFVLEFTEDFGAVSNLDIENNIIYFTSASSVYSISEELLEQPEEPLLTYESNSAYGKMYGFNVNDGFIYTADGGDFKSNGKARIYSVSGEFIKEFTVGMAPNGFYVNE
ncbi:YncE family protein [Zunongwangia sp.]|uniref:YncE family protein n=1 Tax=Zunongwangia sp. TaxID=1965325 RepID=UPI003AA8649F